MISIRLNSTSKKGSSFSMLTINIRLFQPVSDITVWKSHVVAWYSHSVCRNLGNQLTNHIVRNPRLDRDAFLLGLKSGFSNKDLFSRQNHQQHWKMARRAPTKLAQKRKCMANGYDIQNMELNPVEPVSSASWCTDNVQQQLAATERMFVLDSWLKNKVRITK